MKRAIGFLWTLAVIVVAVLLVGFTPIFAPVREVVVDTVRNSDAPKLGAPDWSLLKPDEEKLSQVKDRAQQAAPEADPQAISDAVSSLDSISVAPRQEGPYDRDSWMTSWPTVDGCDLRNRVLSRDLEKVKHPMGDDCKVVSGVLDDPYSAEIIDFDAKDDAGAVQIDHVVPLAWAERNGGASWDSDRKKEFASDPENLLASSRSTNASKSDQGPGDWPSQEQWNDPQLHGDWCQYTVQFVDLVNQWGLSMDAEEVATTRDRLQSCQ